MADPHDLARFVAAQDRVYEGVLAELRAGRKTGHWMWFVFPQIAGLGHSAMARHYAIGSLEEARAYLSHPLLGPRLHAAIAALMGQGDDDAARVMGAIDAMKLRSSMTLFAQAAADPAPFRAVLERFFEGVSDPATLDRLR